MSWITNMLEKITYNKKIASVNKKVVEINNEFDNYTKKLNSFGIDNKDSFFKQETNNLRDEIKSLINSGYEEDEALKEVLPKAYGLTKLAVQKQFNKTYYDVQLMGGVLLNDGVISEMATGEGKTLTAILPTYLNALTGKGAHVITPNDYLAKRDFEEVKPLFESLGLSIGLAKPHNDSSNKEAYKADVTYGSAHAFAFDYLRDTLSFEPNSRKTRFGNPNFVVIDEADAVLFDDALTSYRISGEQKDRELGITKEQKDKMINDINLCGDVMSLLKDEHLAVEVEDYNKYGTVSDERQTHAIYYSKSPKGFKTSPILDAAAYSVFKRKELDNIIEKNKNEIINFLDKEDYSLKDGKLNVKTRGLYKLIIKRKVDELQKSYDNFRFNEYPGFDLNNAANAWFLLKRGIDYDVKDNTVALVMNGRYQEGRQYGKGLQQAVERKEKVLEANLKDSEITDTIASISVSSFYGRYNKFAGMTGTSPKEAFNNLYNMNTVKVPTNKPRNVTNLGEKLLPNRKEKYNAIIEEVQKSIMKGQPILISTTSKEESEKLAEVLKSRISNREIQVLNADVTKLEEEARIINKAGMKGAITIATEMAGRGTDIKLGGENASKKEREEILKAGGLKVVLAGHFNYDRVDRQVIGRTGRQGNKGEYIIVNDYDDLKRIGVNDNTLDELRKDPSLAKNATKSSKFMNAIKKAQEKNEIATESTISYNHQFEKPAFFCRNRFNKKKEELIQYNDYNSFIYDSLKDVVKNMVSSNSYKKVPSYDDNNYTLSQLELDEKGLKNSFKEVFGKDIPSNTIENTKDLNSLITKLEKEGSNVLRGHKISREDVKVHFNRIWHNFEDKVENIETNYRTSSLTGTGDILKNYEQAIIDAYDESRLAELTEIVSDTIKGINKSRIKDDSEIVARRPMPNGLDIIRKNMGIISINKKPIKEETNIEKKEVIRIDSVSMQLQELINDIKRTDEVDENKHIINDDSNKKEVSKIENATMPLIKKITSNNKEAANDLINQLIIDYHSSEDDIKTSKHR